MAKNDLTLRLAGALMMLIGVLKIAEAMNPHEHFRASNTVFFFLSNMQVVILAAGLELGLGAYLILEECLRKRAWMLTWFLTLIMLYKVGSHMTNATVPCSCLGILTKWFGLSHLQTQTLSWIILALFAGIAAVTLKNAKAASNTQLQPS